MYLGKEVVDNIWFRHPTQSTGFHQRLGEDWCRFETDLEFRLHMSMNMSSTCPKGSTSRRLSKESHRLKRSLLKGGKRGREKKWARSLQEAGKENEGIRMARVEKGGRNCKNNVETFRILFVFLVSVSRQQCE